MGGFVLQTFLIVGLLSIIVLVTGRVFRLSPAVRFGLWLVVLIKLLVPPVVEWPWDAARFFPEAMTQAWVVKEPLPESSLPTEAVVIYGVTDSSMPTDAALTADIEGGLSFPAGRFFLIVWFMGSLVVLFGHVRRIFRFQRALSASRPAPKRIVEITEDVAQRLGIPPPRVCVIESLGSPIVWSFGRPLIVIPRGLLLNQNTGFWRCVLAHELAHIRRRDHWFVWLEFAGSIVWWWNPLYWLVRHRLRTNAEMAADRWAVSLDPENRRTYAESLLWVTEWGSGFNQALPALGASSRSRKRFRGRLTMILQGDHNVRVPQLVTLALILLHVLTVPSWSIGGVAAEGVQEANEVAAESVAVANKVAAMGVQQTNMEALITVWPYTLNSGHLVLPEETYWMVLPNYNGGAARGGDDRLIVVLMDPITRQGFADGFWPVIVHMPLSDAQKLLADLAGTISAKPLTGNEKDGMESSIYLEALPVQNRRRSESAEAVWTVMPQYAGRDEDAVTPHGDNRLTIVLQDEVHGDLEMGYDATKSIRQVVVRMDSGVALRFMADLARVIAVRAASSPDRAGSENTRVKA